LIRGRVAERDRAFAIDRDSILRSRQVFRREPEIDGVNGNFFEHTS
jgi:hypothetical protein